LWDFDSLALGEASNDVPASGTKLRTGLAKHAHFFLIGMLCTLQMLLKEPF